MALSVAEAEGEGEADGHWLEDSDTVALRVRVRVTVGEALRLRVGEPLALAHTELVPLTVKLGDAEEHTLALCVGDGEPEADWLGEEEAEARSLGVGGSGARAPRSSRQRSSARIPPECPS